MAREFSHAMNDAADGSGVRGMAHDLRKLTNPAAEVFDAVKDAARDVAKDAAMQPHADAGGASSPDPHTHTGRLSAERKAVAATIQAKTARAHAERKASEAEKAAAKATELERQAARLASAPESGAPHDAAEGDAEDGARPGTPTVLATPSGPVAPVASTPAGASVNRP